MAGKTVHVFTSSGELKNPSGSPITNIDYLVVGGGRWWWSNESADGAAGGGAGGLISSHPDVPTRMKRISNYYSNQWMTVVVGSGGGGGHGQDHQGQLSNGIPGSVCHMGL